MENHDYDVTFSVGLVPGDVKSTAESLRKDVEQVLNAASGKKLSTDFKQLQTNMKTAYKESGRLLSSLDKLENKRVPTKSYKELQDQLTKTRELLDTNRERLQNAETWKEIDPSEFKEAQQAVSEYESKVDSLVNKMHEMEKSETAFTNNTQYQQTVEELDNVNGRLTTYIQRANEAKEVNTSPATEGWKTFSSVVSRSISILKMIPAGVQRVVSVLGKMGSVAIKAGTQVVNALTNLGKQAIKAATQVGKLVLNLGKIAGQTAIRGLSSLIKKVGSLGSALKKTNKSGRSSNDIFKKGFMTLVRYGLGIRSIYFLFKRLRKALGEGIGNLAQYSPSFNNVISNFISALTRLKNTFATAFAPIINVVGPILTTFINLVSEAVTRIGMLIAALTGQKTFIRAKAVQEDYAASLDNAAGSAGNATKAAKEYQKTIAGFDDVEILKNPDKDSSSGGGSGGSGGGGGVSPQDMFETVDIPTGLEDLAERIKQAWLDSNFTAIGEMLGEKLGDALNSIPWDKVQKTANKFGQSFATLINGFVEVEGLGNTIGQTIGEAINTGLSLWEGFVDKLHFDSIGAFIAEGMNGLVITVDWTKLANNIIKTANGIFTLADTWADKFNFKALGTALGSTISSVFTKLDFDKMKSAFSKIGSGLASALDTFFAEKPLTAVGTALGKALDAVLTGTNSFINNLPTKTIGEDLAGAMNGIFTKEELWQNAANALSGAANAVFKLASTWADKFDFDQAGRAISKAVVTTMENITWDSYTKKQAYAKIGKGLANALTAFFEEKPLTAVGDAIATALSNVLTGTNSFLSNLPTAQIGEDLAGSMNAVFTKKSLWKDVATALSTAANDVFSIAATWSGKFSFAALGSSIGTAITDTLNKLQWNDAKTAVKNIATGIATALNNIMTANTFKEVGTAIGEGINTAVTGINNFVSGISWDNWAKNISAGINKFFATVDWGNLNITFTNVAQSLGKAVKAAVEVGHTLIGNIEWKSWGKVIGTAINTFFGEIDWAEVGVTFSDVVQGLVDGIIAAIETIDFENVGAGLVTAIKNVEWDKLLEKAGKLLEVSSAALGDFVAALLSGLGDALVAWFDEHIPQELKDFINTIDKFFEQFATDEEEAALHIGQKKVITGYTEGKDPRPIYSWVDDPDYEPPKVPVVLSAELLEDNVPDEDKKIDNIRANAEKVVDKIEPAKKLFENFKAKFSKTDTTGIPEKERTVGEITAELMTFEDNIPESDKNVGEVTAEIMNFEDKLPANQKYIRDMNGNITGIIETITPTKKVIKDLEGNVVKIVDDVPKTLKVLSDGQLKLKRMDSTGLPESEKKVTNGSVVVSTVDKKSLPNSEKVVTGGSLSTSTLDNSKLTAAQKTVTGVTATVGAFNESKNATGKTTTGYSATVGAFSEAKDATGKSASGFTGIVDTYKEAYNKGKGITKTASGFTATISEYLETDKTGGKKPTEFTATITKYREPVDNKTKVTGKTQSGFTGELTKYSEKKPSGKTQSGFEGQITKYSESKPSGKNPSGFTAGVTNFDDDIASKKKTVSGFTADFSYVTGLHDRVKSILRGLGLMKAEGGAFYGGSWHAIAQYATGGRPRYGTHFVAGEAGPEVVGHIGGRTEVLNQSQLAATMYSAVVNGSAKAIGAILNHMTNCVNSLNTNIGSIININVSELTLLQKIDSALNNIDTNLTAIVTGKMIPNTVSASTTNELIATLRTMANVLQSNQENAVSRDDLTTILTTMFRQYMNISFYMGDEEVARHANNGNARLGYRFDPVVR